MSRSFIDTNVFLYAFLNQDVSKKSVAARILVEAVKTADGYVSLQVANEERFDTIFKAMDGGDFPPQKVFFDGKHYDAYSFARKLVRKAKKELIVIDAYPGVATLDMLAKRGRGVKIERVDLRSQSVTSKIDIKEAA